MIKPQEYQARRQRLMDQLAPNSIAIIPSAKEILRNGMDNLFPFRQNSDFWYLTGFEEPNAILVLAPGRKAGEFILFNQVKDPKEEIWTGIRAGQQGAISEYGADQAYPFDEFENLLPELLTGCRHLYYPIARNQAFDQVILTAYSQVRGQVRRGVTAPDQLLDIESLVHQMRVIKSPAELELMRYANQISSKAHELAMRACKPNMNEYELEAVIKGYCFSQGCDDMAYTPIVGGGKNGCILHYIDNNQKINDGDLVLIDAGGEYRGYSSDITRTFPSNGKFSAEQKAVYEVVLAAQNDVIEMVKPGVAWNSLQERTVQCLTQGLVDLGILKGDVAQLIEDKAYVDFYMHLSGHWLGLDTHDAGRYCRQDEWQTLMPGMAFTVEPGIYIPAGSKTEERWWDIAVRIEDNIVVTDEGSLNLTTVPKEVAEIEALMASSK